MEGGFERRDIDLSICIMAALARDAAAVSGSLNSRGNTSGTICQEMPKRSVSQPHMLSLPPPLSRADHSLSVSA
jgi:hypothetical protein